MRNPKYKHAVSISKLLDTKRYRNDKEGLLVLEKLVLPKALNYSSINKKTTEEKEKLKKIKQSYKKQ